MFFFKISDRSGVVAQLVEHLLCKQGVMSSNLIASTDFHIEIVVYSKGFY